jgi:hypothetical protein
VNKQLHPLSLFGEVLRAMVDQAAAYAVDSCAYGPPVSRLTVEMDQVDRVLTAHARQHDNMTFNNWTKSSWIPICTENSDKKLSSG